MRRIDAGRLPGNGLRANQSRCCAMAGRDTLARAALLKRSAAAPEMRRRFKSRRMDEGWIEVELR
jgi:hypothetical protein